MSLNLSRGIVLKALGSTAATLGLGSPALADPVTVRASIIPIFDVAPMYAAQTQGYFSAENMTVTTQAVQTGAVGIPALIAGAYDVAYSNAPAVLSAIQQGLDLRIILEGVVTQPQNRSAVALFARKGEPLKTGRDFEGKVVAVNGIKNVQWMVMRSWVKMTGGNPDKVEYREVPLPQMLDAIKNKQVDAALAIDPMSTIALNDTQNFELIDYIYKRAYAGGATALWVTTGQMCAQKPQVIRGFQRAYRKGVQWCDANLGKPPYFDLIASYTKIDPALIKNMALGAFVTSNVTPSSITKLQQLMLENGLLDKPLDLKGKYFS